MPFKTKEKGKLVVAETAWNGLLEKSKLELSRIRRKQIAISYYVDEFLK